MSAPVSIAVWPDQAAEEPELHQVTALGEPFRTASVSRGSADRSTSFRQPTSPATVSVATPTPTPEPEPEPTETPTPTPTQEREPVPEVVDHMYVTAALNVRSGPALDSDVVTVLARGTEVGVTGTTDGTWVQLVYDEQAVWVSGDYLSESEPGPEISYAECPSGSSVESGLTPDAIRVHRAVCAKFPDVPSYGGVRGGSGEHSTGHALDVMISNSSLGDAIAAWVREHYQQLGVSEIIWSQQIWTVERASDGWRWMEDRGSATANHYDHVHVTVYGNAGG